MVRQGEWGQAFVKKKVWGGGGVVRAEAKCHTGDRRGGPVRAARVKVQVRLMGGLWTASSCGAGQLTGEPLSEGKKFSLG